MAGSNQRSREEVVKTIVSLLVTEKPSYNIPIPRLESMYKSSECERIPYRDLGYPTIVEFLRTIPQIQLVTRDGSNLINFLGSEKTRELSELVAKQKSQKSRDTQRSRSTARGRGPRIIPQNYYPRSQSVYPPRPSDSLLRLSSDTLELLQRSPSGLSKTSLMYKLRERRRVYIDMQSLNEILAHLRGKVEISDQMVYLARDEPQNGIPWNESGPSLPQNPVVVRNIEVETGDKGTEDFGDCEDNQQTSSAQKPLDTSSGTQQAPQTPQANEQKKIGDLPGVNDPRTQAEVEMIINERMRFRLQKLIQNRPEGIWCAELANIYFEEYKLNLEWQELGFNSLSDLILHLPDIFYCVQAGPTGDFRVFDAKNRDQVVMPVKQTLSSIHNIYPDPEDDVRAIPAGLSAETINRLIPEDVVTLGETIGQVLIDCFNQEDKGYEEVVVCDAFTPSFFWIHLRRKILRLDTMMERLQEFYEEGGSSYSVPLILLERGLNVVCKFYGRWHRGIVKAVDPDAESTTTVLFYDYGTLHKYPANAMYFLHRKFSNLPAQAIPCGLYNIKPPEDYRAIRSADGKVRWSIETSRRFVQRVHDRPLVAICGKKFPENNSMLLSLTDTSSDEDINIGEWLVADGLAVYGSMVRIRPKNFPYKHSLTCEFPPISTVNSPADVSKLSSNKKRVSKVESLRAKLLEKKSAKLEVKCPSCGYLFPNSLPAEANRFRDDLVGLQKREIIEKLSKINGVTPQLNETIPEVPEVGSKVGIVPQIPQYNQFAMEAISYWVETGCMPGPEALPKGLTLDEILRGTHKPVDPQEILLPVDPIDPAPQIQEKILKTLEEPQREPAKADYSPAVGVQPLHLRTPDTEVMVRREEAIDWDSCRIINESQEPKPMEKLELLRRMPKPKRQIIQSQEFFADATDVSPMWENNLEELKYEVIMPIIKEALRNNKKPMKYSRVVKRREVPSEGEPKVLKGEEKTGGGVQGSFALVDEVGEPTEVGIEGGVERSEDEAGEEAKEFNIPRTDETIPETHSILRIEDNSLETLGNEGESLRIFGGRETALDEGVDGEEGGRGEVKGESKEIDSSPSADTSPRINSSAAQNEDHSSHELLEEDIQLRPVGANTGGSASPKIFIEEIIPTTDDRAELGDDNSIDHRNEEKQRILIEELSSSEDNDDLEMVSVYAELLKRSPRFLKQILDTNHSETSSGLDSDDDLSASVSGDDRETETEQDQTFTKSEDNTPEIIEKIDNEVIPTVEKNNNDIISIKSVKNSTIEQLKSNSYDCNENFEKSHSCLELIGNEKNLLSNGVSSMPPVIVYDEADFLDDDDEFDYYFEGDDKCYTFNSEITTIKELLVNRRGDEVVNEDNSRMIMSKSSSEIKYSDDDVEEVYRTPDDTDDSIGGKVDPDDLNQYTEDYDWEQTEEVQGVQGNVDNDPTVVQNLMTKGLKVAWNCLADRGAQLKGIINVFKQLRSMGMDLSMVDTEAIFSLEKIIDSDWENICPEKPKKTYNFILSPGTPENGDSTAGAHGNPINGVNDSPINGHADNPIDGINDNLIDGINGNPINRVNGTPTNGINDQLTNGTRDVTGGSIESDEDLEGVLEALSVSQNIKDINDNQDSQGTSEIYQNLVEAPQKPLDDIDMEDLGSFHSGSSIRILEEYDESLYSGYDLPDTNPFKSYLISAGASSPENVEQKVAPPIPPRIKKPASISNLSRITDDGVAEGTEGSSAQGQRELNNNGNQCLETSDIETWRNDNYLVEQQRLWMSSGSQLGPGARGPSVPPGFKPIPPPRTLRRHGNRNQNEGSEVSSNLDLQELPDRQETRLVRQPDCLQVDLSRGSLTIFLMDGTGWITIDQFRQALTNFTDTLPIRKLLLERKAKTCFKIVRREENPRMFQIIERKIRGIYDHSKAEFNAFYLIPVNIALFKMLRAFDIVSQEDIRRCKTGAPDHPALQECQQILRVYQEATRQMYN